jgi:hypothetical protein
MHDEREKDLDGEDLDGPQPTEKDRKEALDDMRNAAVELIKLIEMERKAPSGGPSWHDVEVALLDIRDAWEGAKACEVLSSLSDEVAADA